MAKFEFLVIAACAALALCADVTEIEQKKRGVDKGTNVNSVTPGAQKQDYTYSIYPQNPSTQTGQPSSYQSQASNSFYPNQGSSQYYSSSNTQADASYQPQPQSQTLSHQPTATQFGPVNFISNPGYQSKYQIVQSKPNANLQLALFQQPNSYPSVPIVPYAPSLFSPHAADSPHLSSLVSPIAPGHYNMAPNYQQYSGSYSQPATMLLFPQPNLSMHNNLVYPNPNPVQSFYNYHPSNSQEKYTPYSTGSSEYDKLQGPIAQSVPREDNNVSHSSAYTSPSDSNSSYKSAYSTSQNTYSKL